MDFEDVLEELFSEIHRALMYLGSTDPDCAGMGATLSMCWFTPGWMYFGHIGDSRIYYSPEARRANQADQPRRYLRGLAASERARSANGRPGSLAAALNGPWAPATSS